MSAIVIILILFQLIFTRPGDQDAPGSRIGRIRQLLDNKDASSRSSVQTKIIDGLLAIPGQAPFQVSLINNADHYQGCGGSLIGRQTVLTAAHCCE